LQIKMSYNEDLDNFSINAKIYGSDYNEIDPTLNPDQILNSEKLDNNTDLAIEDTRQIQLLQNANLMEFDQKGNYIDTIKSNIGSTKNIPVVSEILKNDEIKLRPVPDTIESGKIITIITNTIKTDGTSEVLNIQGRTIISNLESPNQILETNSNRIIDSSVLETNSTIDIAVPEIMGAHGPQRVAKVRINPNAKPIIMCKGKTQKGTNCSRKAAVGCKYCSQHYKKKLESGEISDSENESEPEPEVENQMFNNNHLNDILSELQNKYKFDGKIKNKIYSVTSGLLNKIFNIYTLDEFDKFVKDNISEGFANSIQKVENYNLYDKEVYLVKYIIEYLIDFATEISEENIISIDAIDEALEMDEDLLLTFNPNLETDLQNIAEKELDTLDSAVVNFDNNVIGPSIDSEKLQIENDSYSDETDLEIDQNAEVAKTPKKVYKKVMKVIPKSVNVKKYREYQQVFNLKPSRIIPNKYKNEVIIKPISLTSNVNKTELYKLPTESDQIFEYRKKYTESAFQLGDNEIKWDSCIVLGKMKINKIMFGLTYDQEMENLLVQIDNSL
jgi:hypothetical protein